MKAKKKTNMSWICIVLSWEGFLWLNESGENNWNLLLNPDVNNEEFEDYGNMDTDHSDDGDNEKNDKFFPCFIFWIKL